MACETLDELHANHNRIQSVKGIEKLKTLNVRQPSLHLTPILYNIPFDALCESALPWIEWSDPVLNLCCGQVLWLVGNQLSAWSAFAAPLPSLTELYVGDNMFSSTSGIGDLFPKLENLSLVQNAIQNVSDLQVRFVGVMHPPCVVQAMAVSSQ